MTGWRKSSRCSTGHCVEVRFADGRVYVRDSKNPDGPVLEFTPQEWDAFVADVKDPAFDDVLRGQQ